MGLSNQERYSKILYTIKEFNKVSDRLLKSLEKHSYQREDVSKILDLIDRMWPAALGNDSNSIHWLLGSSSANDLNANNMDPWSIALLSHFPKASEGVLLEEKEYKNLAATILQTDDYFSPFADQLSIKDLLYDQYSVSSCVVEIYSLLENLVYALRRYSDDFLSDRKELSDIASKLQGECFVYLSSHEEVSAAYIAHKIFNYIYNSKLELDNTTSYKDVVDEWLYTDNAHHYLGNILDKKNLRWLAQLHLDLTAAKDPVDILKMRVKAAMRIAGRSFHKDDQFKRMKDIIFKDKNLADPTFHKELDVLFEACKAEHKEEQDRQSSNYKENKDEYLIYGYDANPNRPKPDWMIEREKTAAENKSKRKVKKRARRSSSRKG